MAKIVVRHSWTAKAGKRDELAEVVRSWAERNGFEPRVYLGSFGAWDRISSDLEFDTQKEWAEFWDNVDWSLPENVEALKKIGELRETGDTREMFYLLT